MDDNDFDSDDLGDLAKFNGRKCLERLCCSRHLSCEGTVKCKSLSV